MRFWRRWHRTISLVITVPFLITLITGIVLSLRAYVPWVQPEYAKPAGQLSTSFEEILRVAQSVPEAKIASWSDVSQIDIRPAKGNIRVRSKHNHWEIQMDGHTGKILQSAPRRVGWLTALHEGAYFGEWIRYGIFFPSSIGVLFLLISGLILATKSNLKPNLKANLKPTFNTGAKTRRSRRARKRDHDFL